MALLAQTCSKIGTEEVASNNPNIAHGIRVINSGQGVGGEIVAPGWVQLPNVGDANTAKQLQGAIPIAGGQVIQQGQGGLQLVATQGPNGQIAYVAAPSQMQAVNVEGQDGAIVIPSSGAGIQGQFISMNQQQGIPIMTANGQIIRAQMPQAINNNVMPPNVAFANLGGNVVNLGGNIVNLGGVQGAIRPPGAVMQAIQVPQQMPNFIQVPVSANGQTALMPVQVAPAIQTVQDLSGTGTIVAGSNPQSTSGSGQTTDSSSQSNTKTNTSHVAIKPQISSNTSGSSTATPLNIPVVSFPQIQNVNSSGQQTIAAAAAAANIIPSMQLIPVGGGNFVQAMMPSSQTNFLGGQNVLTLGSLGQSGITTATSTTAATSTVATPQQSTVSNVLNQVPQIIQTLNGQNFANIQIAGQPQVIANTSNQFMQAINLSNVKNNQIPVQVQNVQGLQAVQNLQSFQTINAQGQIQQVFGTPITGIQVWYS